MDWLNHLLGDVLSWFESWTGSYALVLLFYALILKILFLPFAIKQQKNQIKMAKLAPQIETIKAKYKGRNTREAQQQMQQEIMEFQQKQGYNPLAGCLPMLIQLPIIMIIYQVVINPLEYVVQMSSTTVEALKKFLEAGTTEDTYHISHRDMTYLTNEDSHQCPYRHNTESQHVQQNASLTKRAEKARTHLQPQFINKKDKTKTFGILQHVGIDGKT